MQYLVCENWNWRHNKAVVHIRGKCYPQRAPGERTLNSEWFGPYESLNAAMSKAQDTGRAVGKCGNCFRPGPS